MKQLNAYEQLKELEVLEEIKGMDQLMEVFMVLRQGGEEREVKTELREPMLI